MEYFQNLKQNNVKQPRHAIDQQCTIDLPELERGSTSKKNKHERQEK